MDFRKDLEALGLKTPAYKHNLGPEELFYEAIRNDRGRTRKDGGDSDQKAYPTRLGVEGPLVFYSDPSCTGRPVQDTFCVDWPEISEKVWWKNEFKKFNPDNFQPLLKRVVEHLNQKGSNLYVKDVYCSWDPQYAVPYRFVGEFATHALFASIMFPADVKGVTDEDGKRWTMLNVPSFHCDPE